MQKKNKEQKHTALAVKTKQLGSNASTQIPNIGSEHLPTTPQDYQHKHKSLKHDDKKKNAVDG